MGDARAVEDEDPHSRRLGLVRRRSLRNLVAGGESADFPSRTVRSSMQGPRLQLSTEGRSDDRARGVPV